MHSSLACNDFMLKRECKNLLTILIYNFKGCSKQIAMRTPDSFSISDTFTKISEHITHCLGFTGNRHSLITRFMWLSELMGGN